MRKGGALGDAVAVDEGLGGVVDGGEGAVGVAALGEVAGALKGGRDSEGLGVGRGLDVAFGGDEEEGVVAVDDGDEAAERGAPVVVRAVGARDAFAIGEEVVGEPRGLAGFAEDRAVELVGAGAQEGVEDAAAGAADLRVVGVGLDFDVLDGLNGGDDDGPVVGVGDGDAVDEVEVGGDGAAGDGGLGGAVLVGEADELLVASVDKDAGDLGGHVGVAAEDGDVFELALGEIGGDGGGGGIDEGSVGIDLDGVGFGADGEGDVEGEEVLRGKRDVDTVGRREAGRLNVQCVGCRPHGAEDVRAVGGRGGGAWLLGGLVREGDGGVGERGTGGVGEGAA